MRRILAFLLIALCLTAPAVAAEGAGKAPKLEPGTSVEMPFLVAPMSQDGKLLGYAYISSKLVCASPSDCIAVRQKLAFIQDAAVREVNAHPIAKADDPTVVDRDLLNARLTANAKRIVGDSRVRNMVFIDVQYAPLHPSESTAGTLGTSPDQATAAAAAGQANAVAATSDAKPQKPAGTAAQPAATSKPPAKQGQ